MRIRSLAELRQVEEIAARFTPHGFSTGSMLAPASAAKYHQETIADLDLATGVPDPVHRSFERLRELHTYGVLHYDLYSVVVQMRGFVFELALRERFMEFYQGVIPFFRKDGTAAPLEADSFDAVYKAIRRGSHKKARRLKVAGLWIDFGASLWDLSKWGRRVGILRGQRNRIRERMMIELRNHFAHPSGFSISSPVEAAGDIRGLAETFNHMWGFSTPNGTHYPSPTSREVLAIGRSGDGAAALCRPEQIGTDKQGDGWHYLLVEGAIADQGLFEFDPRFELTSLPTRLLWGPGSGVEAVAWWSKERPQPTPVDFLDRLFAIRSVEGQLDPARSLQSLEDSLEDSTSAEWWLVRADHPGDALGHVRSVVDPDSKCPPLGPCPLCPAETIVHGSWEEFVTSEYTSHLRHLREKNGRNESRSFDEAGR